MDGGLHGRWTSAFRMGRCGSITGSAANCNANNHDFPSLLPLSPLPLPAHQPQSITGRIV